MNTKRIVITGGPGTGKTVVVEALEKAGYFCFHEIIRSMTQEAKKKGTEALFVSNPIVSVDDPMQFNTLILEGRLQHFRDAETMDKPHVFYDRGAPDVLAYMDYFNQAYGKDFIDICKTHRYDMVCMLPPWEAIYITDGERFESYEEAVHIHQCLDHTYKQLGYHPITIPKTSVAKRVAHILDHINEQ